jgi:hypothetical protein
MPAPIRKRNIKGCLIQARVDTKEMQEIITKAHVYAAGNLSEYTRLACLNYRPIKRVQR